MLGLKQANAVPSLYKARCYLVKFQQCSALSLPTYRIMALNFADAPIVLFRLIHDGSQDGYFQPTPVATAAGLSARSPSTTPTTQLLRSYLNREPVATPWISFATWRATLSRLQTWVDLRPARRPRNIRLCVVLVPLATGIQSISDAFKLATKEGLEAKRYMEGEYLVTGLVNIYSFLIQELPLDDNFKLGYLPVGNRHPYNSPGILCTFPANMVPEEPHNCYYAWQSELQALLGSDGARCFDVLLDAFTADSPKVVADYQQGGTLAPISRPALEKLNEMLEQKKYQI